MTNTVNCLMTDAVEGPAIAMFVGKEENWDYDSEGTDCVIQAVAFGKIVFGTQSVPS